MLIQRISNILCTTLNIQCVKLIDSTDSTAIVYTLEEAFIWLCCHRAVACKKKPDLTAREKGILQDRLYNTAKGYGLYRTISDLFTHISNFELPANFKPSLRFSTMFSGMPSYGKFVYRNNKPVTGELIVSKIGGLQSGCEIAQNKISNPKEIICCLQQMATMPWLSDDISMWDERWRALPMQQQVEIFDIKHSKQPMK